MKTYRMAKLEKENEKLREALIWCSGSEDFAEGGKARKGWLKICKPLLDIKDKRQLKS